MGSVPRLANLAFVSLVGSSLECIQPPPYVEQRLLGGQSITVLPATISRKKANSEACRTQTLATDSCGLLSDRI